MEASELRVGISIIYYQDSLITPGINDIENIINNIIHPYRPVPLTEEWLLKFGFESENTEENDWYFKENENRSFGLALQDGV